MKQLRRDTPLICLNSDQSKSDPDRAQPFVQEPSSIDAESSACKQASPRAPMDQAELNTTSSPPEDLKQEATPSSHSRPSLDFSTSMRSLSTSGSTRSLYPTATEGTDVQYSSKSFSRLSSRSTRSMLETKAGFSTVDKTPSIRRSVESRISGSSTASTSILEVLQDFEESWADFPDVEEENIDEEEELGHRERGVEESDRNTLPNAATRYDQESPAAAAAACAGGAVARGHNSKQGPKSTPGPKESKEDYQLAMALQEQEYEFEVSLQQARDQRQEERRLRLEQLSDEPVDRVIHYKAPKELPPRQGSDFSLVNDNSWTAENDLCVICFESLSTGVVVSLQNCNHLFHLDCIDDALVHSKRCPKCRKDIRRQIDGTSPTATMSISRPVLIYQQRQGNQECMSKSVIQIEYTVPDGTQMDYHEFPGQPYKGTTKVVHLPRTLQAENLVKRLVSAFTHGLTFRVTIARSGEQAMTNWATIPHKFSSDPEEFRSSDLALCHEALDQLGVPTKFHY